MSLVLVEKVVVIANLRAVNGEELRRVRQLEADVNNVGVRTAMGEILSEFSFRDVRDIQFRVRQAQVFEDVPDLPDDPIFD